MPSGSPLKDILARFDQRVAYKNRPGVDASAHFDRERLRSVLENLIKNALETVQSEQPVEVRVSSTKAKVTISVLDRGEGISPEIRERIYDPFYTSKISGSGIGLAITRRFVEAVGGSLTLSARSGGGTEAAVCLKRAKNEDTGR